VPAPGSGIVLYARNGAWWVQPLAERHSQDSTEFEWINSTHLGTESHAALLVEPGYRPLATMDALPPPGSGVSR